MASLPDPFPRDGAIADAEIQGEEEIVAIENASISTTFGQSPEDP